MDDGKAHLLEQLRAMKEVELHRKVIEPLLREMGARGLTYVHGANERGKDFVYLARGFMGKEQLTVCQVKNEPLTGRATDSSNITAVLSQIVQCRQVAVVNPVSNAKELPQHVVLITTYPLPDGALADGQHLLEQLRVNSCEVVPPDDLADLIAEHLPSLFVDMALPGTGVQKALATYLAKQHDAGAFEVSPSRDRFFVNLGASGVGKLIAVFESADSDIPARARHREGDLALLVAAQNCAFPGATEFKIFRVLNPTSAASRQRVAFDREQLRDYLGAARAQSTKGDPDRALRILHSTGRFLHTVANVFSIPVPQESAVVSDRGLAVAALSPIAVLRSGVNLCLVGRAGAGKTSLCKEIAAEAIREGVSCVYFPCNLIEDDSVNLLDAIASFHMKLVPGLTKAAAQGIARGARVIVIDGCDEAASFGAGIGEQIRDLSFPADVSVPIGADLANHIVIPPPLRESIRIAVRRKGVLLSLQEAIDETGYEQWRSVNSDQKVRLIIHELYETQRRSLPQVIVSTRDSQSLRLPQTFLQLTMLPFNDQQLQRFFDMWFDRKRDHSMEIMAFFDRNPHIKDVCRIPIAASILAALKENGYDLPQSRTELYESYIRLMLGGWDAAKRVRLRNSVRARDKQMLLRRLAWELHTEHRRTFTLTDVERIWNLRLNQRYPDVKAADLIEELLHVNSLIFRVGKAEYNLGHLSFQEFLAAEQAVYGAQTEYLLEHFTDPWWAQVLSLYAGKCGDVERFVESLHKRYGANATEYPVFAEIFSEARFTPSRLQALAADILDSKWDEDGNDEEAGDDLGEAESDEDFNDEVEDWDDRP